MTGSRVRTLAARRLELGPLSERVRVRVPPGLCGPVTVEVWRVAGWTTEAVRVRMAGPGGLETDLDTPVSFPPADGDRAVIDGRGLAPGRELTIGADASESGAEVWVIVRAVVAAEGAVTNDTPPPGRGDGAAGVGCGCGGFGS